MHDSSRALLTRGSIAAVAAALVLGSSFAAPAIATTAAGTEPVSKEVFAAPTSETSADANQAGLPSGLQEAVARDLGITIEEFYKNGELSAVVDSLTKELKRSKLVADFAIVENKINVTVAASALEVVTKKLDELTRGTEVELNIVAAPEGETSAAPEKAAPMKNLEAEETKATASKLPVLDGPKIEASKPKVKSKAMPQSAEALLDAYVENVEPEAVSQLQAVMKTDANSFVIRTGGTAKVEVGNATDTPKSTVLRFGGKLTPEEFAEQYTKVTIEKAEGPAKPAAAGDVLGGMGYGALADPQTVSLCSLGFTGFNAAGANAVISAGHCTLDGDITNVDILEHSAPNRFDDIGAHLGTFGFSQFGGTNNSPVTGTETVMAVEELGNIGTDISVIDKLNPDLDLKEMVTDWKGADERDSGTKVTGVASAVVGANICKSGRTTGWTCGTVDEVGIFFVGGYNGAGDVRGVRGFGMANKGLLKVNVGDSGGSVISGGTAVGLTSAVVPDDDEAIGRAYFTDIKDGLKHTKGYSIALFLNAPAVPAPANGKDISAGQTLDGTVAKAPAGSTVKVVSGGKEIARSKVANGKFSFKAPAKYGNFDFTLQTINGFNESATTAGSFKVIPVAPSIELPEDGQEFAFSRTPKTISGFGINGAAIKVTIGETELTATVADGAWTVLVPAGLKSGDHKVTAVQVIDEVASAATSISFTLAAEPKPEPTASPEPSKAPMAPQGNTNDDDFGSDPLANTGPNAALPFIATGGVLLVASGAFMLFRRKNTNGHQGA